MVWMIILVVLAAVIGGLLWARNRQEREWQLELAYLTRHQREELQTQDVAVPEEASEEIVCGVGPNIRNVRAQRQQEERQQSAYRRRQEELQRLHPRSRQAQALSAAERHAADDAALDDLPIFAGRPTLQEPVRHVPEQVFSENLAERHRRTADEILPGGVEDIQTVVSASDVKKEAESAAGTAVPADEVGDEDDSASVPVADGRVQSQPQALHAETAASSPMPEGLVSDRSGEDAVAVGPVPVAGISEAGAPALPAEPPEIITLEEATRRVRARRNRRSEPPVQRELVELNPVPREKALPPRRKPGPEITPEDPAVRRVRAHTNEERRQLSGDAKAEQKSGHSNIIGEDDIRSNLLRQRLARRRDAAIPAVPASAVGRAVIAEEEVRANLAKSDSPVNRHKATRPVVRESVIPASARIGRRHAVRVHPVAAPAASTALAVDDGPEPIFTRFTPYYGDTSAIEVPQPVNTFLPFEADAAVSPAAERPPVHERIPLADAAPVVIPEWQQTLNESVARNHTDDGYAGNGFADTSTIPWSESLLPAADDAGDEDDIPEWQQTLNESMGRHSDTGAGTPAWSEHLLHTGHTGISPENTPSPQPVAEVNRDAAETVVPAWLQPETPVRQASPVSQATASVETSSGPAAEPWKLFRQPAPAAAAVSATASVPSTMATPAAVPAAGLTVPVSPAVAAPAVTGPLQPPPMDLLLPPQFNPDAAQSEEALLDNGIIIEEKLAEFKVKVNVTDAYAGPVITRYEIEPAQGVRGSQVVNLEKDLARSLGFASIRVVETIPGKTCMGLELPNPKRQIIRLSEILTAPVFTESRSKLTLALGQDITGNPVVTDLAKAPHLLVAGTTGSGKSVGVNAMILSMLFKATPEEVRLIMIDPKMLELSIYEDIPHLLAPVVTDMRLAANALTWCVNEMEKRYRLMSHLGVRNVAGFNQKITEAGMRGQKIANPFSLTPSTPDYLEKLPYIVVVVDEFADLMMTAGKKIEELIARLAQKARAAGIHLILATQRPSVDVITGLIKANIPTRMAFQVSSKVDSRTILDQMGAENLLGQGDMLFLPPGTGYPQRVHGAFVADEEVHRVVDFLKQFGGPDYVDDILTAGVGEEDLFSNAGGRSADADSDPLYDEAIALVVKSRKASISSVQRQLRIGYNRAARLIEQMEADGIVSAAEGNGNRTVLAPDNGIGDD